MSTKPRDRSNDLQKLDILADDARAVNRLRAHEKTFAELFRNAVMRRQFQRNMQLMMGIEGISFVELSKKTEVDASYLNRVARDQKVNTSFIVVASIAEALHMQLSAMLTVDLREHIKTALAQYLL